MFMNARTGATQLLFGFTLITTLLLPSPSVFCAQIETEYWNDIFQIYFNENGDVTFAKHPALMGPQIRPEIKLLESPKVQEYLSIEYLTTQRKDIDKLVKHEKELSRDIWKAMTDDKGIVDPRRLGFEWKDRIREMETEYDEVLTEVQHQQLVSLFLQMELKKRGLVDFLNKFNKSLEFKSELRLTRSITKDIENLERRFIDDAARDLSDLFRTIEDKLPFEVSNEISEKVFRVANPLIIDVLLANQDYLEKQSEDTNALNSLKLDTLLCEFQHVYVRDKIGNWILQDNKTAPFISLCRLIDLHPTFSNTVFSEQQLLVLADLRQQYLALAEIESQKLRAAGGDSGEVPPSAIKIYSDWVVKHDRSFFEKAQADIFIDREKAEIFDFCLNHTIVSKSAIGLLLLKNDMNSREIDHNAREKLRQLLEKEIQVFATNLAKKYDTMIAESIDCLPAEHAKNLSEKLGERPEFVKPEVSAILHRMVHSN